MTTPSFANLSRREREMMDIIYRLGEAGAAEVAAKMKDDPGYDSVRVTLGILEKKGHLKHRREGRRYVFSPKVPHKKATRSAWRNFVTTFFRGSPSQAILSLLDMSSTRLSQAELDEIADWVERERRSHNDDVS